MANYVASGYVTEGYVQSGISIDWTNRVIVVPKGETTLVQSSPVEIRELDLNAFRLALKNLEDSETGMVYPTTHVHVAPVAVGGVTLARILELINDYTVTFEDGKYAVNLTGANSNVGDKVNVNQVSVRSANSAGLVQTDEIETATYAGGVSFDLGAGVSGLVYPIGTPASPVNNLQDAKLIQSIKNLPKKLYINGFTNFGVEDELSDWIIEGNSNWSDHMHTFSGGAFTDSRLINLHVAGSYLGLTTAIECRIGNGVNISGDLVNCYFTGLVTLNGNTEIINGFSASTSTIPNVDCGGIHDLQVRGYNGSLIISGITNSAQIVSIDLTSGSITIDSSCTAGTIELRGNGDFIDNSAGATVITTGMVSDAIHHSSFDGGVTIDVTNGVAGTEYPKGTGRLPSNNITDAVAIATTRGFKNLFIRGNLTLVSGDSVSGYHVHGEGASLNVTKTSITLEDGCSTSSTHWYGCRISGKQGGESFYHKCMIDEIWNAHCFYEECGFITPSVGTFTVQQSTGPSAGHITYLTDCYSDEGTAVIDRAGVKESQRYSNWTGNIKFINQNNAAVGPIWVHLVGGSVEIDSSCTEGIFHLTGDGNIINNSGGSIVRTGVLQKIDDARIAVESLRPTHQGYGSLIYVDPVVGNDINDGETKLTAVRTFARAHDLAHDGENDVILFINQSSAGYTHLETMVITKNNVHLRSASRDITFKGAVSGGTILTIGDATGLNGYACSAAGMLLDADKAGAIPNDYCIVVNGKFSALNYMWVKQPVLDCIQYRGGDYHTILDGEIEKSNRHGISMEDYGLPSGSPREITIFGRSNIYLNGGDGIHIGGTGNLGSTTRLVRIIGGEVFDNTGYGIHADANVSGVTISAETKLHSNTAGDLNILTTKSFLQSFSGDGGLTASGIADAVWSHIKALTVAKFIGLK